MSLARFLGVPDVSWMRKLVGGGEGGVDAYQVDASGLDVRNRLMWEWTLPVHSAPSVRGSFRAKSTLQANNPSFEGMAMRCRGFDQNNNQVWDSRPETKGRRAWFSQQSSEWVDVVFVEPMPRDLPIVRITFELVIRASSGQITLCRENFRYHYEVIYNISSPGYSVFYSPEYAAGLPNQSGQAFNEEIVFSSGGEEERRHVRYISTFNDFYATKGKYVSFFGKGYVSGTYYESKQENWLNIQPGDVRLHESVFGFMVKLRREGTSQYDYVTVGTSRRVMRQSQSGATILGNAGISEGPASIFAEYSYDQAQLIIFGRPEITDTASDFDFDILLFMLKRDIELKAVVSDHAEPSQS